VKRNRPERHGDAPGAFDDVAKKSEVHDRRGTTRAKTSPRVKDFNNSVLTPIMSAVQDSRAALAQQWAATTAISGRLVTLLERITADSAAAGRLRGAAGAARADAPADSQNDGPQII